MRYEEIRHILPPMVLAPSRSNDLEVAKSVMKSVMASVRIMEAIGPEWKWTGLGNFLGAYGEFIAVTAYGLIKAPGNTEGHDAVTQDGRTVSIKANHASNTIGFRGSADFLLVIHIAEDGTFEQVYWGDFAPVEAASKFSSRDNKQAISLSKLRALSQTVPQGTPERLPAA